MAKLHVAYGDPVVVIFPGLLQSVLLPIATFAPVPAFVAPVFAEPPVGQKAVADNEPLPPTHRAAWVVVGGMVGATAKVCAVPLPQPFDGVTVILPEPVPTVTVMLLVVLLPVHPEGKLQL